MNHGRARPSSSRRERCAGARIIPPLTIAVKAGRVGTLCTRILPLLLLLVVISCAAPAPQSQDGAADSAAGSGPWLQYADVQQAGFDAEALRAVCAHADRLRSGAVMAVFRGRVLLACGDVARELEAHSVRKSLVSALYGTAIARKEIDLESTLADHSIDDETPLTATEKAATLRQVISARSGVYLTAAYAPTSQDRRPQRGSHAPGTHWFYNNWDFNVAGVVYERATKEDLYESFKRRIADPVGMEDWDPSDGFRVVEPTKSRHPAHTFRISARDLARVGQLYLQNGRWEERQLLPAAWVEESTRPHTDDGDGTGYGYMWWTYQAGGPFTRKYPMLSQFSFYRGWGTGEQGLWVIPGADLVVVHRADTDHGRSVESEEHWRLVESILAARRGEPQGAPSLKALEPTALSSQVPADTIPEYRTPDPTVMEDYLGDYTLPSDPGSFVGRELTPAGTVRVFFFEGKPFFHVPGAGDVEMFRTGDDTFTVRAVRGVSIVFERGSDDEVTAVTLKHDSSTVRASVRQRGRS